MQTTRMITGLMSFLAIVSIGAPALAASSSTVNATASRYAPASTLSAVPKALRPALYGALARDADAAQQIQRSGCAVINRQALQGCFDSHGAQFDGKAGVRLQLRLVAYGRASAIAPIAAVRPRVSQFRVDYVHQGLTEWWRALPIGFEQGFTLDRRPSGHGRLTLVLATNHRAGPTHRGTVRWGQLRYGRLVVTDARGKVIPATLTADGRTIQIAIEDAGARFPLRVDPTVWLEQKATANDGAAGDQFGYSVAIAGTTALIGAFNATDNGTFNEGAVYVFTETGGSWSQAQKLIPTNSNAHANFGWKIAMSGDLAIIAAPGTTVNKLANAGAAYVFGETNGSWSQVQTLTPSDAQENGNFGQSVAFDGTTVMIGAGDVTVNGNAIPGSVYVFTNPNGTWSQDQELSASDEQPGDEFGFGLAVDGSTALIGSPFATVSGNSLEGAVYAFTESSGVWTQAQKFTADNATTDSLFGYSIALDGTTGLIGALGTSVNGNAFQGAAYIFGSSGGTWSQTQQLTAGDGGADYYFGNAVALEGTKALIGSEEDAVNGNAGQGAAYLFENSNGSWTQTQKLTASDGAAHDVFGISVALSGNSNLVGAYSADVNGNQNQGAAYFYGATDLGLTLSAPSSAGQDQDYVSETVATNTSSVASPAVTATVTVPAAASYVSASANQGSCSEANGVVSCAFGPIVGNGGSATADVTLKATGGIGTTIDNTSSIAKATPSLSASAPTSISACGSGYSEYSGNLSAGAHVIEPDGQPYRAPAGQENGVLMAPQGFVLYVVYGANGTRHIYRVPGNSLHRYGPAGDYAWVVKAGTTGGAFTFCLKHP